MQTFGDIVPDSSRADRTRSYNSKDFKDIVGNEEDWKFLPLNRLAGLDKRDTQLNASIALPQADGDAKVELINRNNELIGQAGTPEDLVSAKAWESFKQAVFIDIPESKELDQVAIVHLEDFLGEPQAVHIVIRAGKFSKGTVILNHKGKAEVACNVEIIVEDSAQLTVVSLQDFDDDAVFVASQQAKVGRDAYFKHINITLGGDLIRLTPTAVLNAPGSEVDMYGMYFADAGQYQEHRSYIDHADENCKSNVMYKGALQGKEAHTVWVGDVLIRKEAEGTDTYELNRNLILTDGARADSVPNLEIETGVIEGAGHASTTGRFDDEHLFYLQSRGIEEEIARRLVVRGFLNEIIQKIGDSQTEEILRAKVDIELGNEPEVDIEEAN
ncbi:MAG: Fe-S cluster assembly protein SufD [Micrococcaceae bacterium]